MKKVLITGGAGYIGSILSEILLEAGYQVTILDNLMYNQISLLHLFNRKNINFIKDDVTNYELLIKLVKSHDIIIPLAAIVGAPACDLNKELSTEINFVQIKNIVDNLTNEQILIVPNTNSQYGSSDEIITENSPFNPLSHYAKTKCDAENYVLKNGNGICLRLATVFGISPRMRTDLLVNDFTLKSLTDGYLVIFEGHFKRNYIHVRDVANTFLFCIENYAKMNNNVFNVGLSQANISKLELALEIKKQIPELVIVEENFKTDFDKRNYIVSNKKLESLGWNPNITLSNGITELINGYKMIINYNRKNFTNL